MSGGGSESNSENQSQSTSQINPQILDDVLDNFNQAQSGIGSSTYSPLTAGQISTYENPYQSDVINSTMAALQNQNQQQTSQNGLTAGASGDYNSNRLGVQNALTNQLYSQTAAQTLAQLENQNYNQASTTAQTENTAQNQYPLAIQALLNQTLGLGTANQSQSTSSGSSQQAGFNISFPKV